MSDLFDALATTAATHGTQAMLSMLADSLKGRRRWHALFDLRLIEARAALGLPPTGDAGTLDEETRTRLDEKTLDACREVGWPLLDDGQITAGWMYLRAAAEPADVSRTLAALAQATPGDDETAADRLQEIIQIALWEGVDPALGIRLVIKSQGTCNAITAYEQALSRLPAVRQRDAAAVLVEHLHGEVFGALAADLGGRGLAAAEPGRMPGSIVALLDAAGGLKDDPSVHVDVSHLQSVLRIGRVCTDRPILEKAWELAVYACRLPDEMTYPGEPPFENVAEASRLFFTALLGREVDASLAFFHRAATTARIEEAGTLPADTLVYLLWRLGQPAEALRAALARPSDHGMPSTIQASGMLPSLVDLAVAGDAVEMLRTACRERGDEITFAASYLRQRSQPGRVS